MSKVLTEGEAAEPAESGLRIFNPILSRAIEQGNEEPLQLYFQQLWQMDNVMVLLGAGFCKSVGGPLMEDLSSQILPKVIQQGLIELKASDHDTSRWRTLWKLTDSLEDSLVRDTSAASGSLGEAVGHCRDLNIETKISELQAIRSGQRALGEETDLYDRSLERIKSEIVARVASVMPSTRGESTEKLLLPYRSFMKHLVKMRRPQQPRIKLFTTNYDVVVELACDLEGIRCITGFEGESTRTLNPTVFDVDLTYRGSGQTSVFYPNVLHLYKLHGSVDWILSNVEGTEEVVHGQSSRGDALIYPCYTKFAETLESPYFEMFRRFGDATSEPQSVLLSIGYGFQDEHINQMVWRAYKNPSCQLLLCEPRATERGDGCSAFLKKMLSVAVAEPDSPISDPRVTVVGGDGARFPEVLPHLFSPIEIEDPSERMRALVRRLVELGQNRHE